MPDTPSFLEADVGEQVRAPHNVSIDLLAGPHEIHVRGEHLYAGGGWRSDDSMPTVISQEH